MFYLKFVFYSSSFPGFQKELAKNITTEQGKTLPDAEGDVMRGLQVVEHSCAITMMQMGQTLPGIAKDMDCTSYRVPLGVCAGITPFNFPAMIPLWVSSRPRTTIRRVPVSKMPFQPISIDVPSCHCLWKHNFVEAVRERSRSVHDACRVGQTSRLARWCCQRHSWSTSR